MWNLLGLEQTDESVYRYDLSSPGATASQTARATGLSNDTVEACRGRLVACGLLREEQPGEYRATPTGPAIIADRLRDEIATEYAHRRSQVSRLQADMTRLIHEHLLASSSRTTRPQVDPLPSGEAATMRITELLCVARTEVAHADPGDETDGSQETDLIAPEIKAAERGVAVRTLYPPASLVSEATRRAVGIQIRAGISVRAAAMPAKLTIVDRRVAVLTDHRDHGGRHTLLLRDGLLVYALHSLFEMAWTRARDASSLLAGETTIGEVNNEELLMLQLLGEGLKDELVAKRLGISVRTVRRKVGDLLHRLRAKSRFQAGAMATKRGWV